MIQQQAAFNLSLPLPPVYFDPGQPQVTQEASDPAHETFTGVMSWPGPVQHSAVTHGHNLPPIHHRHCVRSASIA